MKILILGVAGMLGNQLFRELSTRYAGTVFGTARRLSPAAQTVFADHIDRVFSGVEADDLAKIEALVRETAADVVINCIGVLKQLPESNNERISIRLNALLPHELADICQGTGSRLIHFSTDCVFRGDRGGYSEEDRSDAIDLYGRTKLLGEVTRGNALTLRTSIIGHELSTNHSLIGWFLSQTGKVSGYRKAIFTGLPTTEVARVLHEFVLPNPGLTGVYQPVSEPISKYDLLGLVARTYGKQIDIVPSDELEIDRSLDGSKFRAATGYVAPAWPDLVVAMHRARLLPSGPS